MALSLQTLGLPGRDNAALARLNTGQSIHRLLFDCGQGCLESLSIHEIRQIDHVFFSHFHMDHIAGFDFLFRLNYDRPAPMHIWGPVGTRDLMAHRFQGFTWNIHSNRPGEWVVHEICSDGVHTDAFVTREAFRHRHPRPHDPDSTRVLRHSDYSVTAIALEHGMPCLGYVVREASRSNIDMGRLVVLGLKPGPWMQQLKNPESGTFASPRLSRSSPLPGREGAGAGSDSDGSVVSDAGIFYPIAELRKSLLIKSRGSSVAYLTDFRMADQDRETTAAGIAGCDVLVCESQYRTQDSTLARKNFHMTAAETAELARLAGVGKLILIHVSDRYDAEGRAALLAEARSVFARTEYPEGWGE